MSEHHHSGRLVNRNTMWASWVWIAGVLLITIGRYGAVEGLTALFKRDSGVAGPETVLDPTNWRWLQLIVVAVAGLTGLALFTGAAWVRWAMVLLAVLNTVGQLVLPTAYPMWSVIVLALCVAAIVWAIVWSTALARVNPRGRPVISHVAEEAARLTCSRG